MQHKQQTDFDIIVLGGGLIGATLALILQQQGKSVLLVEKAPPTTNLTSLTQSWDARIYAVSPANQQLLNKLGVWPAERVQPVSRMEVYGDTNGHISFDAASVKVPYLNYMLENRYLLARIWLALVETDVTILQSKPQMISTDVWSAQLTLENGSSYRSQLLIGADGAQSWLRQQAGITVNVSPYKQQGLVANFNTEKYHHGCAYQWFSQGDILAYLPLLGHQISIVWSTASADKLSHLNGEDFACKVAEAGKYQLGELSPITPVFAFDLIKRQPQTIISQRIALIGDAAHTVHPLAGQGVNLGFADVEYLSQLLAHAEDLGSWSLLRQYQRSRLLAVRTMQQGCDGLFRLFANNYLPGISWLRNQGMNMVNNLDSLKNQLIRQAMGL